MGRFTKDEMLDELRTIFLYEADHLILGAGTDMAAYFIGFEPTDHGLEYLDEDTSLVDLKRFQISDVFDRAYDLAFSPSMLTRFDESEIQDLNSFMLGTPKSGGTASGGMTHSFMTEDGYCQIVCDIARARWNLEFSDWRGDFTTRELALLANMTEGAVRNALADKSENGLKAIPGMKPVSIEFNEAKRWLMGRRGFIPSPQRLADDRVVAQRLAATRSAEELGQLIRQCVRILEIEVGQPAETMEAWFKGSFTFDAALAQHLAEKLGLEVPLFVGKALEVSLRRDANQGGQP